MNPSKRDIEALKLFYDINDNEEANKLLLNNNWENTDNDIVECIYDSKNAVFDKNDITASFFLDANQYILSILSSIIINTN